MNVRRPGSGHSPSLPRSPSAPSRQNSVSTPKPTTSAPSAPSRQNSVSTAANTPLPPSRQNSTASNTAANTPLPPSRQNSTASNTSASAPKPPTQQGNAAAGTSKPPQQPANTPAHTPTQASSTPAPQQKPAAAGKEKLSAPALDSQGHPNTASLDTPHHGKSEYQAPNQLHIGDHAVTMTPIGEHKVSNKMDGTSQTQHSVGTPEHKLPGGLTYQNAGAGLTHTQGNGTAGITHQQVSMNASAGKLKQEGEYLNGHVKTEGSMAAFESELDAAFRLNTNPAQFQAITYVNGKAASGAQGKITGHIGNENANLALRADGKAGAFAEAQGGVVIDPKAGNVFAQGRVAALAGAEAKVHGQAQLGPFIVYGGVGAKAGVGYEANVGAGMQNGVIKAQADLGGALGLGASASAGAGFDTNWMREHRPHRPNWMRRTAPQPSTQGTATA